MKMGKSLSYESTVYLESDLNPLIDLILEPLKQHKDEPTLVLDALGIAVLTVFTVHKIGLTERERWIERLRNLAIR